MTSQDEDDVKPGFMRTEFFGSSYKTTAPEHSPYQYLYDENMSFYMGQNGTQAGDPEKAAELYIKVAEMEIAPDGYRLLRRNPGHLRQYDKADGRNAGNCRYHKKRSSNMSAPFYYLISACIFHHIRSGPSIPSEAAGLPP